MKPPPSLLSFAAGVMAVCYLSLPWHATGGEVQSVAPLQIKLSTEQVKGPTYWIDPRIHQRDEKPQRIVVWFDEQFLGDGEAYARRSKDLAGARRTLLREEVIQLLKETSDRSFADAKPQLEKLAQAGTIRDLQRHWIINGVSFTLAAHSAHHLETIPGACRVFSKRQDFQSGGSPNKLEPAEIRRAEEVPSPPFQPDRYQHPWYTRHLLVEQVWSRLGITGQGTLNVIQDNNFAISPNAAASLYINPNEIPGNGIDDDENGLVDDIHGYDFVRNRGTLTRHPVPPNRFVPQLMHGHACALIICGRGTDKSPLELGLAPDAKWAGVMAGPDFEPAVEWAIEQAAVTYSMSFSIPNLGELRSHYRKVMEQGSFCGLFFVSGAGNFAQKGSAQYAPVPLQMRVPEDIPEVVFAAAGIQRDLSRTPFSSQGPVHWQTEHYQDGRVSKPEVCAFNAAIPTLGTDGRLSSTRVNGNSFAGPMFCGTIALMLSADPDLLPWDLKEIVTSTALDVGPPGYDHQTGHGLINAFRAVKEVLRRRAIRENQNPAPYTGRQPDDELDPQAVLKNMEGRQLVITSIQPDSPWDVAGLKTGDVVQNVSGTAIGSWLDLRGALQDAAAKRKQHVEVWLKRTGQQIKIQVEPRASGIQVKEEIPEPEFK
jgi:subtilisin family serine protease